VEQVKGIEYIDSFDGKVKFVVSTAECERLQALAAVSAFFITICAFFVMICVLFFTICAFFVTICAF
jgi:hypothetical protein